MTTTELLEKYDKVSKEAYDNCIKGATKERALWNLLKANEKHIQGLIEEDETGYWFHKAFRQVDICESPEMDMAIWQLLSVATLFWEMLPENVKN
jgi:hypothetical protein